MYKLTIFIDQGSNEHFTEKVSGGREQVSCRLEQFAKFGYVTSGSYSVWYPPHRIKQVDIEEISK